SGWSQSESRIFGYISELLLDVWLNEHKNLNHKELSVGFIGNQHWIKKIYKFIFRKIFKK
ncbi:MAG: exopolysaccharide biosynthesis protein, partial [Staphylococcus epidermidis]|nr:exopolysaccharide biosynthesis protein [Staphylococcus epidermidis]